MQQEQQSGVRAFIVGAIVASMSIATLALCAGCETTEGAGRDLENLGDNIEDAAADAKD